MYKVTLQRNAQNAAYSNVIHRSTTEKTIEGDLFAALVKAGAISKANANDPKKSALVRCARTDKGVHAAGNVVSLKLIIEDEDIVTRINDHLSPQIRVWGIERTVNSFSCYQSCDSRWYEYLIPTHCFLPPHPRSYLGKKLVELAEEVGDLDGYRLRQEDVEDFWEKVDEEKVAPILDELDDARRLLVEKALYDFESYMKPDERIDSAMGKAESGEKDSDYGGKTEHVEEANNADARTKGYHNLLKVDNTLLGATETKSSEDAVHHAAKVLKQVYLASKKAYRISSSRRAKMQEALSQYVGSYKYHNFTVKMTYNDSTAMRHIKSFDVSDTPIIINGTEWLSLKVHGQSFMMHQIRKMVGMATLVVRCGCEPRRIQEAFKDVDIAIPKAPGLGLLLERPIFDSYNEKISAKFGREPIDFGKFQKEMDEFKEREIYQRIFREEEEKNEYVF